MKILISTDGSKFSQAAVDACSNIAFDNSQTSFKIISAVEFPTMIGSNSFMGASAEFYQQIESDGQRLAKEFLEVSAVRLRGLFPDSSLNISTEVLAGSPSRLIIELAETWEADLIVIGSHGYGFWDRALLGSVSASVVHHAPCSVLVVKTKHDPKVLH